MKIVGRDLHMRYQQVPMLDGASAPRLAVFETGKYLHFRVRLQLVFITYGLGASPQTATLQRAMIEIRLGQQEVCPSNQGTALEAAPKLFSALLTT